MEGLFCGSQSYFSGSEPRVSSIPVFPAGVKSLKVGSRELCRSNKQSRNINGLRQETLVSNPRDSSAVGLRLHAPSSFGNSRRGRSPCRPPRSPRASGPAWDPLPERRGAEWGENLNPLQVTRAAERHHGKFQTLPGAV